MNNMIFKEVPEVVHNAVLNALDSLEEKNVISFPKTGGEKKRHTLRIPKIAVACMVCFLVTGITVSAVGIVNSYRQRMEAMDNKEIEEYYTLACVGETNEYNRSYTAEERDRYTRLEKAYETSSLFPEAELNYISEGSVYDGNGVALDTSTGTIYLPDRELTDEELLVIIDFNHKLVYSIYQTNQERILRDGGYESRLALMDDAEVDRIYLVTCSTTAHCSGGYNRALSGEEEARYAELVRRYEEEGLYTDTEPTVIWKPGEYTGEGIAICVQDGNYYLPDTELTDDQLLQIIDYQHKIPYCLDRIHNEIMMGLRDGYPPRANVE